MDSDDMNSSESFDATKPFFDLSTSSLTAEDARKCLTGDFNVVVPTPTTRPCNNLDEYLYKSTQTSRKNTPQTGKGSQPSSKKVSKPLHPSAPFAVPLVRNFERILKKTDNSNEVSPSSSATRPKKLRADVFSKAEQIETDSGPLSHLKQRLDKVVRVLIRRRKKVAYISRTIEYKGTLVMFDKHMNMFLKDVIESFKYHKDGNILKRGRHRDEIMLRGDNIILVI